MILGITGTNGAGKGEVVKYLVEEKGFTHCSVRDAITSEIEKLGLPVNRTTLNEVATELRKQAGPAYFSRMFIAHAKEQGIENIVIESIRNPKEAEYIREQGGFIVVVDADRHLRFERVMVRKSATDHVTFEEFCVQEDREMKSEDPNDPSYMDIGAVMALADATILNEGTFEELHTKIETALAKLV